MIFDAILSYMTEMGIALFIFGVIAVVVLCFYLFLNDDDRYI